jgi:hypothetical protein
MPSSRSDEVSDMKTKNGANDALRKICQEIAKYNMSMCKSDAHS